MTPPPRILVVEDDAAQRLLVAEYLRLAGFAVVEAQSLAEARARVAEPGLQLVLLDIGLPDGSGLAWIDDLQRRGLPVIIVSCREADRIAGLELGVDDFLGKPVQPRELLARIRNLLRRAGRPTEGAGYHIGAWTLDPERRTVRDADGRNLDLTRGEFDLLAELAAARGRVLSRAELAEAINPDGDSASLRSVDVLVSRLRHKLEPDPTHPRWLCTTLGVGYRLDA